MQKEYQLAVDIEKKILTPSFEVNTLDLKTIKLKITITKGMSLVDLTDITVRMSIRKPDGNVLFQDCQVVNAKNGQVEIILENQAYVMPGSYSAEIMCFKGADKVAVTGSFSYRSIRGIMDDKAIESKSEFTAITGMIGNVESIVTDLKKNGTGIDAQARQGVEQVTSLLADIVTDAAKFSDFQTATAFLKSNNKFTLHFPKANYNVNSTIELRDYDYVVIDGNGSVFSANSRINLFDLRNCKNVIIRNVNYVPVNSPGTIRLLRAENVENGLLSNCTMQNGDLVSLRALSTDKTKVTKNFVIEQNKCVGGTNSENLIGLLGTENITIRNNFLTNAQMDGIKTASPESGYKNDNISIYNNEISYCSDDAFDMYDNGRFLYIANNYIHHCKNAANLKQNGTTAHADSYKAWFIYNRVEYCTTTITMHDGKNVTVSYNHFENCGENLTTPGTYQELIMYVAGTVKDVTISNNHFIKNRSSKSIINLAGINTASVLDISDNIFTENSAIIGIIYADNVTVALNLFVGKNRSYNNTTDRFFYSLTLPSNSVVAIKDNFVDKQIRINPNSGATNLVVMIQGNTLKDTVDPIRLNESIAEYKLSVIGNSIQLPAYGPTSKRPLLSFPSYNFKGNDYFDTTINKKVYWTGTAWVDAMGVVV